ncbi:SGNH/GDSL hydrolase family protein [Methanobacterium paludis]|uniref:Lipolytic protein G-D-S-L family n=1 Tax=Methanobacterium paludis (strain DSM 25820 / JCM 18151 / SWAN1) TaxID=868131 RepID=F6D706_METPW|nr:SGNH/GDSL hydrolase family protein [Methanobacterium paludis]AEG18373.1 lipolytic protein G-D-S-L family [Methanobacterium paludis]
MIINNKESIKIVTVVGDSLSMVRPSEGIVYQDTYSFKLQKLLGSEFHVVQRSKRMNDFLSQSYQLEDDVLNNGSNVVVFHIGIVDCAPRLFGKKRHFILNLFLQYPVIKNLAYLLIKFKSRYRRFWTHYFPKTFVSESKFRERLEYIVNEIRKKTNSSIILINIADTTERNKFKSYDFEKNIKNYNEIIKEVVKKNYDICNLLNFYDLTKNKEKLLLEDGIHISKKGHDILANSLYNKIKGLEKHGRN